MQYHQPTKKFVVSPVQIERVADHICYALKKVREAGGLPLTPYESGPLTASDHAQCALMDIAKALDIDLGQSQHHRLDLSQYD